MRTIVYVSIIILSMAVFVAGIMFSEVWLIVPGGAVSVIVFLYFYLKLRKERERFDIPEDKYETVLSMKTKQSSKIGKKFLGYIMTVMLGIVVFIIIYITMKNYLFTPSSLSIENVINGGCKKLNTGDGLCNGDPSTITVDYDVNGDGIVGGVNDTLSNLLGGPNCDTLCIKKRCGCRV